MKSKTAVAISGGIDSLVTAFLLKQQGHDVIGIHFITGYETDCPSLPNEEHLPLETHPSAATMKAMEDQLEIPIFLLDCRKDFQDKVVQYFTDAYLAGKTPNPCLVCNPAIKFDTVRRYAKTMGADILATGHYVNKKMDTNGKAHLFRGDDSRKDQSYFLAFLSREQLVDACFPLGTMGKKTVVQIARDNCLQPVTRKESQDICFIRGKSYMDIFQDQAKHKGPGPITDRTGNVLGEHQGLHLFTVGQRKGINCPAEKPYYVLALDTMANRLIVGEKEDLLSSICTVEGINWINRPAASPITASVKIRYQHEPAPATIELHEQQTATIRFQTAQQAITPGQGAVFYIGDEVIGGGWITGDR